MISKNKRRPIAVFFLIIIIAQTAFPTVSWALTSGPTQPEVQSFQPAGTTEMVDLFSGDFSYNIPLFELPGPNGGYPFNLSYQGGITMDQEASWVGLGWSLQPGAITRQMRGLPDEFKGDEVSTKMSIKPNITIGVGAGVGFELFGKDKSTKKGAGKGAGGSLSVGFSIYHNNYKGLGYSIDASVGFENAAKSGLTGGVGLGLSLDGDEGATVSPSLSLGGKIGEFGLSAPFNSKSGLSSIGLTHSMKTYGKDKNGKEYAGSNIMGSSASISLANPGYTPQVTMPMKNINVNATFKIGVDWWGVFGSAYITGFYNEQWLAKDKKYVDAPAYGYLNYQAAQDPEALNGIREQKAMLDFNREKDGMVSKESPNLGIPSLTYDIYSVTGQGIGMMYRPFRNDHGIVYDQYNKSTTNAIGAGVDIGPAASHIGANLSVNHAESTSGKWVGGNELNTSNVFLDKKLNRLYEPWYFKVHGESVSEKLSELDAIGGEKAVRVKLEGPNRSPVAKAVLESRSAPNKVAPANSNSSDNRDSRNHTITPITNGELLSALGEELVPYYNVEYFNESGSLTKFERSNTTNFPKHHIAGYTALNADGLRYVYGIPAYNLQHEDVSFSVLKPQGVIDRVKVKNTGSGDPKYDYTYTDEFLKSTKLPKYAHSHLLTSIIGPDYVDVTNNGVTYDDLGYWVKFTYKKTTANYQWRDPFYQAHYEGGWDTDPRDDRGNFSYGKKELWYLAQAETKSHVAKFEIEVRKDGMGVAAKLQDDPNKGESVYKLTQIKLYSRDAGLTLPIKVVKFEHDYSLCGGVYNNIDNTGKLTLTKVWFEYGKSSRGRLNPYEFKYSNSNPGYDMHAYDRWGNYKPYSGNPRQNYDFPYSDQDPKNKEQIDGSASSWNLSEITLPSGGTVTVDYESDDYAYVQQKQAMQMTAIVDPYTNSDGTLENHFKLKEDDYKVRFKLEEPIEGTTTLTTAQQNAIVMKYIDTKTWQLFFKMKINIRSDSENLFEYISGYVDINKDKTMSVEKDGTGKYSYGSFYVKGQRVKKDWKNPFSYMAWQHVRTNQPEFANSGKKLDQTNDSKERAKQIKGLVGVGTHIRQLFENFYNYCERKEWGKEVDATASWIRLNSPDKIKFGGGARVKQITMKDQWAHDEEGVYGQIYDYTMIEGADTISSGIAAYEPMIGGEENALRYAKKYVQSIPMRADNNLFFEYPANETNYPGAQVGYRKVTVMSLASAARAGKKLKAGTAIFPKNAGYGTTGMTVHEFYTAKDFPVIADETEKDNKPFKLSVPIPFLGNISIAKLSTTQGYSIITNDMHGKQKKVSNYRQAKGGDFETNAISWVQYNYMQQERVYNKEKVLVLSNVLTDNHDETLRLPNANDNPADKCLLGQETEFFYDMREYEDVAWTGGARLNADVLYFFLFAVAVPAVWPNVSQSTTQLRSAVTNKIIFKTGILQSVQAFDGGSMVTTNNLKWDKQTGQSVLTSVNNNFDNPIYSYTRPAFREYQGMGAAFSNIGLTFTMSSVQQDPYKPKLYQFQHVLPAETLIPGDEILLYASTGPLETPVGKVIYTGEVEEDEIFFTENAIPAATSYQCMIVRSGYRNQLTVSAGTITALADPSEKGTEVIYTKTISVPK
jgi:hypothetical protein